MKKFVGFLKLKLWRIFSSAALVIAAFFMTATGATVYATQNQICGNGGSGYCMNAWNGGPNVNMYRGGVSNEDFVPVTVPNDCNHGKVSAGGTYGYCPFVNHWLDEAYVNDTIVQIQDQDSASPYNGYCIGGATGTGYLLPCGTNNNGTGAGIGTIMVEFQSVNCGNPGQAYLVDRYWSDYYDDNVWVASGGNPGTPVYVNSTTTQTCWGGLYL